jgi:hypothetical protein
LLLLLLLSMARLRPVHELLFHLSCLHINIHRILLDRNRELLLVRVLEALIDGLLF